MGAPATRTRTGVAAVLAAADELGAPSSLIGLFRE